MGSTASTGQGVTGEGTAGGSGFGNVYTAYGSVLIDLNAGDSIKAMVYSYDEDIDLLGHQGLNHNNGDGDVNFGDTYIEIIDMLGGRQGPTGSIGYQGITGPQGSGEKGHKGEAGSKGEKGEAGSKGERGEGITGATGPQGVISTQKTYDITVSSSGGSGDKYHIDTVQQDTIYLFRGFKYVFSLDSSVSGHPFAIQTDPGASYDSGMVYSDGITASPGPYNVGNNFPESGTITFIVPNNAPNNLYYRCKHHSGMGGTIVIKNLTPNEVSGQKGEKGQKGTTGDKGSKGVTGPEGPQGNKGFSGEKGNKGDKGEKGEQGQKGPQGFTGFTGMTGPQGFKGEQGSKGENYWRKGSSRIHRIYWYDRTTRI